MRTLLLSSFVALMTWFCVAAEKNAQKPVSGTNNLTILNDGGTDLSPSSSKVVFRKNVRAFHPDMYLECDLMTLLWLTNSPAQPTGGGLTNLGAQIETITAETNVLMMARGTTILGDRAVYTRSNERIVVTGDPVIIERENLLMYATNCVYDRLSNNVWFVGTTETDLTIQGGIAGTNAPKAGFSPFKKIIPAPSQPKNDGAK